MVLRPALNTPLPPISRSSLPQARSLAQWGAGWRRPVRHGLWSGLSAEGRWWESGRAAAAGGLKENGGRIEQQRSVEGWNHLESFPLLPQSTGKLHAAPMEDIEQIKDSMKQKLWSFFLLYCDIYRSEMTTSYFTVTIVWWNFKGKIISIGFNAICIFAKDKIFFKSWLNTSHRPTKKLFEIDFCINCTSYITNENRPFLDFWKHCHLKRVYCKIKIFFNMDKGCNICQNGKKSAKITLYLLNCGHVHNSDW